MALSFGSSRLGWRIPALRPVMAINTVSAVVIM
jgi:hypothetical protein